MHIFFSPWEWKQESCKAQRGLGTPANWQNYSMNNSFPLQSFQVCIGIIVLYFFDGALGPGLPSWLPRFPWRNFSWHREMHVTKTKRFRTAEMNSPMSDRSTGTNWTHKEGLNMSWAKQCVQVVTGSTVGVKAAPPILQQKAVLHQFFLEGGWWFWGGQEHAMCEILLIISCHFNPFHTYARTIPCGAFGATITQTTKPQHLAFGRLGFIATSSEGGILEKVNRTIRGLHLNLRSFKFQSAELGCKISAGWLQPLESLTLKGGLLADVAFLCWTRLWHQRLGAQACQEVCQNIKKAGQADQGVGLQHLQLAEEKKKSVRMGLVCSHSHLRTMSYYVNDLPVIFQSFQLGNTIKCNYWQKLRGTAMREWRSIHGPLLGAYHPQVWPLHLPRNLAKTPSWRLAPRVSDAYWPKPHPQSLLCFLTAVAVLVLWTAPASVALMSTRSTKRTVSINQLPWCRRQENDPSRTIVLSPPRPAKPAAAIHSPSDPAMEGIMFLKSTCCMPADTTQRKDILTEKKRYIIWDNSRMLPAFQYRKIPTLCTAAGFS